MRTLTFDPFGGAVIVINPEVHFVTSDRAAGGSFKINDRMEHKVSNVPATLLNRKVPTLFDFEARIVTVIEFTECPFRCRIFRAPLCFIILAATRSINTMPILRVVCDPRVVAFAD